LFVMVRVDKISNIPPRPGVYIMKNSRDEILYIGKAKNLRKRVSSYFQKRPADIKTASLVTVIAAVETIITDNEIEALLLESNLIKQYRPKYNIELKDNQKYPYIKVTSEDFPRLVKTRIKKDDGALYFGPYTSAKSINRTIRTITEVFPIRRCSRKLHNIVLQNLVLPSPCLNYHLGRCAGPCSGAIDKAGYSRIVREVVLFLKGQNSELLHHIKSEMEREAAQQRYEQALLLKQRYQALKTLLGEQKVTTPGEENEDIVGTARSEGTYSIVILKKRNGRVVGKRDWIIQSGMEKEEVVEQFLDIYYSDTEDIPQSILLPFEIENAPITGLFLRKRSKKAVRVYTPKRGVKKRLIDLASKNARQRLEEEYYRYNPIDAVEALREALDLDSKPSRIEAFDISTILGEFPVASMVKFVDGLPEKRSYRKFRIRYTGIKSDVQMMSEAVARRYQRLLNEQKPLPDLILVDGGKPQVNAAHTVLVALCLEEVPVAGLAKREELVYTPGRKKPFVMEKSNEALRLLMAIRNEAHRFAHTYHRNLRISEGLKSRLTSIPGIGDVLAKSILASLGEGEITVDSLKRIKGVGAKRALEIYNTLYKMPNVDKPHS
jgi:excinuclease ABC subunit C